MIININESIIIMLFCWIFIHNACMHMPTIDPIHMRIVDHALRMIDTFLGSGDSLRIALWTDTCRQILYFVQLSIKP